MLTQNNPSPVTKIDITTITKDNIDSIDGLFDKVNIYDLIPKGKTLSYFFQPFVGVVPQKVYSLFMIPLN
jgi:hypothetical protein